MSQIATISRILAEAGHVMGDKIGTPLAAYHVARTVRDSRRYKDKRKGISIAQQATKNWWVNVRIADDGNKFEIASTKESFTF